jgi:tetratricopeptide (TPR) repeat protein
VTDIELETPELDDVDEEAPTYKRIIALVVVLITLFGSVVAYLQSVESNQEDVAARDAQRDAITGLGAQVDASAAFASDLRIGTEVDVQLQREVLNAGRVNALNGDPNSDVHLAAAEQFAAARAAIAALTPIDLGDPSTIFTDLAAGNESADAARLQQVVEADRANDHGGKADSYVAVLTVLAVALFLLGLSLTVQGRTRYVLAAPGVVIALVCVAWTVLIATSGVTQVSQRAVELVAEGQRLQDGGDFEGAIDAYTQAIDDSPDFAAAFARRADARFQQGSAQIGQTGFISITSEEALEDAVDDTEEALARGAGDDVATLADAAFIFYLDRDFGRSVELSEQALELNDSLAPVWFNLGVAELAQGNERAAERAYREGRQVLADAPDEATRSQVLAGARTDLSILRDLLDDDELEDVDALIESIEGELAAFEASFTELECPAEPCPVAEDVDDDTEISDLELVADGALVQATYRLDGAPVNAPITTVWYVRTDEEIPFQQTAFPLQLTRVGDGGVVASTTLPSFDPPCPLPGEYLVRAYAGQRFLGEASASVAAGVLEGPFALQEDDLEGFTTCVPASFTVQRSDVSDIDAFTSFAGEDFVVGVNVTPGAVLDTGDTQGNARAILAQTLGIDESDLVGVTLSGITVEGEFISIPAFAGVADDGQAAAAFAAGPDASSRFILLTGNVDLALLQEVIALTDFTNVGAS